MTGLWNDFNSAQDNANLIPKGTLARVRLTIRPGGFDDPAQGWTGGYATRGAGGAAGKCSCPCTTRPATPRPTSAKPRW